MAIEPYLDPSAIAFPWTRNDLFRFTTAAYALTVFSNEHIDVKIGVMKNALAWSNQSMVVIN